MSRRTAFPNIWIKSIAVEKPPFDEPGVIQEFVGRGVTKEFDFLEKAAELSKRNVGEFLENAEYQIGPLRDTYKIKYNLLVRAPLDTPFNRRGVSARARSMVRAKNPFEPDVIEVSDPTKNEEMSEGKMPSFFDVTVTVTK